MSERTEVTFTVRTADAPALEELCEDFEDTYKLALPPSEVALTNFLFTEVKGIDFNFEAKLQKQKIPYDKSWLTSGDFDAGSTYHRIDKDNRSILLNFDLGTEGMVPLQDVIDAVNTGTFDQYSKEMKTRVTVISWREQQSILTER